MRVLPGGLQHHDRVLALVRAGGCEGDVDVGEAAAARVAMAATCHAAHLNARVGHPGGKGLQARREGMQLGRGG